MIQIILSTLLLSAIHATIPNHWIPLIAVSKAENWTRNQTLKATLISGFAHTLSTILIGVLVGFAGYRLSERFEVVSQSIAPIILIGLGLIYIYLDWRQGRHGHHGHSHDNPIAEGSRRLKGSVLFTLSLSMFLTPCLEIEAYYFQAGVLGWKGIFAVSAVYTVTTVLLMLVLVAAGMKGVGRLRSHTLEHHEKRVTGIVLAVIGVLSFFVKF
jgi:nickel/cobalt transporter (NicO) family protein